MCACSPASAQAAHPDSRSTPVYVAHLHSTNTKLTGLQTMGEARFTIKGDSLTISVKVKGAPPNISHWQHFHGFKDNHDATCPTQAADANGDGIIDLIETEPTSGTTMVPFNEDPAGMDVAHGTYPRASAGGTYEYGEVVSLEALDAAFGKAFDGRSSISTGGWFSFTASLRPPSSRHRWPHSGLFPRKSRCRSPAARSSGLSSEWRVCLVRAVSQ